MTTEATTDAPESAVTDAEAGRGRPRPKDTIDRDERVLALLRKEGPLTRVQVAEKIGVQPSIAYMSLFRLRRDGSVRRVAGAGDDVQSHTWEAIPTT